MQVLGDGYEIGISLSLIRLRGCVAPRGALLVALFQIFYCRRRVLEEGRVGQARWVQHCSSRETALVGFLAFGILDLTLLRVVQGLSIASARPEGRHVACKWRGFLAHWRLVGTVMLSPGPPS